MTRRCPCCRTRLRPGDEECPECRSSEVEEYEEDAWDPEEERLRAANRKLTEIRRLLIGKE